MDGIPELEPATAAGAAIEAWRCIRSVLAGEPVPVITGDVQGVIIVLAQGAAGALTGRLGDVDASDEGARSMALGFVEDRLSRLLLDERLWMPDDPPLPLGEPNEQ